jgi:hypothetical protein
LRIGLTGDGDESDDESNDGGHPSPREIFGARPLAIVDLADDGDSSDGELTESTVTLLTW